jgi:hypothetical protein
MSQLAWDHLCFSNENAEVREIPVVPGEGGQLVTNLSIEKQLTGVT